MANCILCKNYLSLRPKNSKSMSFSITLRDGRCLDYARPAVMGIINLTPDSFYAASRALADNTSPELDAEALRQRVRQMLADGAQMLDVGACSTRPGYTPPSADEELRRLAWGLPIVREIAASANVPISVDTYRASVAEAAVTRLGADIINDVYAGTRDEAMFDVVARTGAPYILMADALEVDRWFRERLEVLANAFARHPRDVRGTVILDPGYGFSKTLADNYLWMRRLPQLIRDFSACPMLVGISRKSMIFKLLANDPDHSLTGTTVLNTLAIEAGAHILRVHDVREAVEAVKICEAVRGEE